MTLYWRDAEHVELVTDYYLADRDGRPVKLVRDVRVACEGGFLHVAVPGMPVQMVSAPAVRHVLLRGPDSSSDSSPDESRDGR
jgi:hypothetical protein